MSLHSPTPKFHSPTKRDLERSQQILQKILIPKLLKQETFHAWSKRPQIRCGVEADFQIQKVLDATQQVKMRLEGEMEKVFQGLEGKIDKLELERDNCEKHHLIHRFRCILPMSPPPTPTRETPSRVAKQKVLNLRNAPSIPLSPSSPSLNSPQMLDYSRKKRLLEFQIRKLLSKLKTEVKLLQSMFEANFKVLKFRRAEHCVLTMIKVQRRLKGFENNLCQLRDRLMKVGKVENC